jgi:hypothetical protein
LRADSRNARQPTSGCHCCIHLVLIVVNPVVV